MNIQGKLTPLFFTLKVFGKLKWFKVGTEKNGYRVADARKARTEKYNEINKIFKDQEEKKEQFQLLMKFIL